MRSIASSPLKNLVFLCGTGFQPVSTGGIPRQGSHASRITGKMPVPHFFNRMLGGKRTCPADLRPA